MPAAPTVTVGTVTSTSVTFNWTATGSSYVVETNVNNAGWVTYSNAHPTTSFTGTYPQNTSVALRVKANNNAGTSGYSNAPSMTTPVAAVSTPYVYRQVGTSAQIAWTANPEATSYVLTLDGTPTNVGNVTSYTVALATDVNHSVTITAVKGAVSSAASPALAAPGPLSGFYAGREFIPAPAFNAADPIHTLNHKDSTTLVSPNGRYVALMRPEGEFAVFDLVANRQTAGSGVYAGSRLIFQGDGNLVLYNAALSGAYRVTDTVANLKGAGVVLQMQDDGNLVIYGASWNPLWAVSYQPNSLLDPR